MKKIRTLLLILWLILALTSFLGFASKAQANGSFELTYAGQPGPLFNETNLAPLDSVTKQITVKNLTGDSQKFALNLQNLLGTSDAKLADVLTAEIIRDSNIIYKCSKLSALKNTETFLENIPSSTTYVYDIKVTMADVGNEYQGQEVKFDLVFGWLEETVSGGGTKITPQVLGTTAPSAQPLPVSGADVNYNWIYYFLIIGSLMLTYYLKVRGWQKIKI